VRKQRQARENAEWNAKLWASDEGLQVKLAKKAT
jgi:hypothetical protein